MVIPFCCLGTDGNAWCGKHLEAEQTNRSHVTSSYRVKFDTRQDRHWRPTRFARWKSRRIERQDQRLSITPRRDVSTERAPGLNGPRRESTILYGIFCVRAHSQLKNQTTAARRRRSCRAPGALAD